MAYFSNKYKFIYEMSLFCGFLYLVFNFKFLFPQWSPLLSLFCQKKCSKPLHWNQFWFQAIPKYLESCRYLPKLNNERPAERNSTYKERFSSLLNLVLIMVSPLNVSFFDILGIFQADLMRKNLFICHLMLYCNSLSKTRF